MTLNPVSHGPVCGASAGLSCTPTDMVTVRIAASIETSPIHPNQEILPSVRTLASRNPSIAETATKTAVQVPWTETALRPMEAPTMADPTTNIMTVCQRYQRSVGSAALTNAIYDRKELSPYWTKHELAGVDHAICPSQLESKGLIFDLQTFRCLSLICPITYPDHVMMAATAIRHRIPGTIPSTDSAAGRLSTPSPIWDFKIRMVAPSQPTCR